ncbi:MAG: HAD hydrolase-like protein, partial [Actinomycetota bacterium]|nr:HAD hydrolase-like protein [Actinomycetota bacterium]
MRVVSVDVFDTLVWRTVAEPVHAFPMVADRLREEELLAPHVTSESFFHLRIRAEEQARAVLREQTGSEEVDLAQVYRQLPLHVRCHRESVDEAVAVEVEVERSLILPDLDVVDLLTAARERGKRIVAVSDTYFTEQDLRTLLGMRPLSDLPFERLFVSSAHGVGKGYGLFDVVLRELGVPPEAVVHVGDNVVADVETPRRLGLRTVLFERRPRALAEVVAREAPLGGPSPGRTDAGLTALRAKVSHRAAVQALPAQARPFWQYGASTLGPVLTGFAEWVQQRAQEVGVDRVHCLMREGALLADLVNVAGDYLDSPVRAEKAWLSRQVCARASVKHASAAELESLLSRVRMPTVREFCTTLGVRAEQLPTLAGRTDERLSDPVLRDEVVQALTTDPDRRGEIVATCRQLRERVVRYVRTLVPDGGRLVLVDLGWAGSIQGMLQHILREEGVPVETLGLYLVTHHGSLDWVVKGVDIDGFLTVHGEPGPETAAIIRSPEILEQVCMPDFGSQTGLTAELEPVLGPRSVDVDLLQGVERDAVQKGYRAFQREWARYAVLQPERLPRLSGCPALLRAILTRSVAAPTEAEARLFSTWVHDENYGSESAQPVMGGAIERALRHLDPAGLAAVPMGELYWPFGMAALYDWHLAWAAGQIALGRLSPDTVSSVVESGPVEFFADAGYGYSEAAKVAVEARRNRFGLSHAGATLRGPQIRTVRVDPGNAPAVLRVDWLVVRCTQRGRPEPVEVVLDTPEALSRLKLTGCRWLQPKVLLVDTADPNLELALGDVVPGTVYEATVKLGYAVLLTPPPPPGPLAARAAAVRRGLRGPVRVVRG